MGEEHIDEKYNISLFSNTSLKLASMVKDMLSSFSSSLVERELLGEN